MNTEAKKQILEEIKKYNKIIITRHYRPDGDAVGSTIGLAEIIRASFPEKTVLLTGLDKSNYVSFLGEHSTAVDDSEFAGALAIVIDTGTFDRVSDKRIETADKLIVIDHHIREVPFGDVVWVEEHASSACEMIVDFYTTFKDELKLTKTAANCLYTGMVTDSGRFRYDGTSAETLRLAAELLEYGVDTEKIYANLYTDEASSIKYKSFVLGKITFTENGVAWVYISKADREALGVDMETASNCVSMMDSIKGSLIWIAILENGDGTWRVRLRSRFVTIQELATNYHGGGHACASGATLYEEAEINSIITNADAILKDYKEHNEGWL